MNARSFSNRGLVLGLLICAGAISAVSAQPTSQPGTPPPPPASGDRARGASQPPMDGKALRELIERRIEEHKAGSKRFEEALKKLDAGGDPAAIGKELLDGARESRRPGGGRPQGGDDNGSGRANAGGGGGRGSEFGMINGPKLSDDDRKKVREMLAEKHPELLKRINQLAGGSAETNDKFIDGVGGRLRWLESMREKEPEEYKLRLDELNNGIDVMKLGRDIADAKKNGTYDAEAAALRSRLTTLMTKQFDTRQELSKLLLQQLRERAEKQASEIAKKDNERSALIEQRSEEFMRMIDGKSKKSEPDAKPEPKAPAKP